MQPELSPETAKGSGAGGDKIYCFERFTSDNGESLRPVTLWPEQLAEDARTAATAAQPGVWTRGQGDIRGYIDMIVVMDERGLYQTTEPYGDTEFSAPRRQREIVEEQLAPEGSPHAKRRYVPGAARWLMLQFGIYAVE